MPFDEEFTIYVWFDALLTYITGIGYGDDEATFQQVVAGRHPLHRQGHHALPLRPVAGDAAGRPAWRRRSRCSATASSTQERGPATSEDQQVARQRRRADGDHHEVQRARRSATTSCASARSPATASSAGQRFAEVYNTDLANNLGNLLSRCVTLITKNYDRRARRHGQHRFQPVGPIGASNRAVQRWPTSDT